MIDTHTCIPACIWTGIIYWPIDLRFGTVYNNIMFILGVGVVSSSYVL